MSVNDSPKLPLELERKVFELAAHLHPSSIPALLRVAHRILVWIEPLLCKILVLTTLARNYGVLERLEHKPASLRAVSHVLLYAGRYDLYAPFLKDLVAACPEIVSLSLRVVDQASFLPLLDTMHI
ncbi:hypothetical protein K438DRAFT_1965389 [Mycena galopus ATCC 62051]|nr:hypothetical protein K438DRAFT_1965389 [Mycena galopus ATCC 62051]